MSESTKKRNNYNTDVVNTLASKYGVSSRYVTMSLNGDRKSATSETILREYNKLVKAIKDQLRKEVNKVTSK